MKKNPLIYAVLAATLLSGAVACDKQSTTAYDGEEGTGKVVVAFNFDESEVTRAYATMGKTPTTTWQENIKSLSLYLVDASGMIKVALPIDLATLTGNGATPSPFTFSNVPVGSYTGYLVANYDQTANVTAGFSGTTKDLNISTLLMGLVTSAEAGAPAGAYKPAGEIFLAKRAATNVVANTTNDYTTSPFTLKRAVSMLRVRINPNLGGNNYDNSDVVFGAKGRLIVRKVGNQLSWDGAVTPSPATASIYSAGFNTGETVTSGLYPYPYSTAGKFLDEANGQTAWKDVLVYPGGGKGTNGGTGAVNVGGKFNIAIGGEAPAGYKATGGQVLANPTMVYWSGTVEGVVAASEILVLNVDLINQGDTTIPPVTETGLLKIGVQLAPWTTIGEVVIPM